MNCLNIGCRKIIWISGIIICSSLPIHLFGQWDENTVCRLEDTSNCALIVNSLKSFASDLASRKNFEESFDYKFKLKPNAISYVPFWEGKKAKPSSRDDFHESLIAYFDGKKMKNKFFKVESTSMYIESRSTDFYAAHIMADISFVECQVDKYGNLKKGKMHNFHITGSWDGSEGSDIQVNIIEFGWKMDKGQFVSEESTGKVNEDSLVQLNETLIEKTKTLEPVKEKQLDYIRKENTFLAIDLQGSVVSFDGLTSPIPVNEYSFGARMVWFPRNSIVGFNLGCKYHISNHRYNFFYSNQTTYERGNISLIQIEENGNEILGTQQYWNFYGFDRKITSTIPSLSIPLGVSVRIANLKRLQILAHLIYSFEMYMQGFGEESWQNPEIELYLYKDGQEFNSYSFQKFENDLWPIVGKSDQEYVHQNSSIYGKNIHMTSAAVDIIWKSSKNFAIGLNVGYSISLGMFTNQPEDYSYSFGTFTEIHNVNNQLILPSKTTFLNKSRLSAGLSILYYL